MNEGSREDIAEREEWQDHCWEMVARRLLNYEKSNKCLNYPESIGVLITWRGSTYIGSIQVIVPDYSEEIVVVSKSSQPLHDKLDDAIRKLAPERLEMEADRKLDMTGRQHILRRAGNRLVSMTPEQTAYMVFHPIVIHEINIGDR